MQGRRSCTGRNFARLNFCRDSQLQKSNPGQFWDADGLSLTHLYLNIHGIVHGHNLKGDIKVIFGMEMNFLERIIRLRERRKHNRILGNGTFTPSRNQFRFTPS